MRILLVNDYGTPTGGAECLMLALRDRLRQQGHEARLFTSTARPLDVPIEADDTCFGTTSGFRTLLQAANPWAAGRLREVIGRYRPDVVHVKLHLTQLSPLILPVLRDVPAVYSVADYRPICPTSTRRLPRGGACHERVGVACYREGCLPLRDWGPLMAQMRLWRRWHGVFERTCVSSEWMRRRIEAEGLRVDRALPNGVPDAPPRPPLQDPPTVAFAGRLVATKGVGVLLDALARVRREVPVARLLVAGDGPLRGDLERRAEALGVGDGVAWLGYLPRAALEEALAPAWVQAVPSVWDEPFGLAAVEPMMRGTAVVASGAGGLAEIVRDGETGRTVPPGDPDALARALLDVLQDRGRAEAMGRAGRRVARERYSVDAFARGCLDLYSDAIAVSRPPIHA